MIIKSILWLQSDYSSILSKLDSKIYFGTDLVSDDYELRRLAHFLLVQLKWGSVILKFTV